MAVVVRGISATLGSFGSGWLKRWTTSYVMVLVCIGGLEVGSLVFLIAWERQPSFGVIVIFAAIFGLCYGLNETVGLGKQFTHSRLCQINCRRSTQPHNCMSSHSDPLQPTAAPLRDTV